MNWNGRNPEPLTPLTRFGWAVVVLVVVVWAATFLFTLGVLR